MPTPIDTASEIESLIESWRSKLHELDATSVRAKPALDRWSISEVVGHLVDSACNNHQRFVRAQHFSELVFPKYEQNEWIAAANYQKANWGSLVELWYHYNRLIATLIRNIQESSLSTPCTITPYETRTLGYLVTDYLDHMKHHLAKIADRTLKTNAT
ncbi:DinB family protein [Planctomycetaceae bacterium SH139]